MFSSAKLSPYRFLLVVVTLGVTLFGVVGSSAEVGQEFHIYKDGTVHMIEAEVIKKHALNFLRVEIWEQKWGVIIDYATTFESAYGEKIKSEEIETGHRLEIKGRPIPGEAGTIEALWIRDLSIRTGTPPSEPQSVSAAPAPASLPAPAPLPAPISTLPPSGASGPLTQQLFLGMRGGEVVVLQEFLQKYNWGIPNDGPVTGYFGTVTRNAVVAFQKVKGLEPVGEAGPQTRSAINAILGGASESVAVSPPVAPTPALTPTPVSTSASVSTAKKLLTQYLYRGLRGGEVVILQEFLQKYGWGIPNDGSVTGYFGIVTENAVKKFQSANGLEALGAVGPKTRELINVILAK